MSLPCSLGSFLTVQEQVRKIGTFLQHCRHDFERTHPRKFHHFPFSSFEKCDLRMQHGTETSTMKNSTTTHFANFLLSNEWHVAQVQVSFFLFSTCDAHILQRDRSKKFVVYLNLKEVGRRAGMGPFGLEFEMTQMVGVSLDIVLGPMAQGGHAKDD